MTPPPHPSPQRQRQAEDIFFEVVEQGGSTTAIEAACGSDAELRAEVQSLLAHHRREEAFLDTGKLRSLVPPAGGSPLPMQTRVGGYTILGVLGTGGMGVVYIAQQERPRRTVALKLIRRELSSPGMLRRFEHEAEVLGRLQHPGIAQIFEAGTADSDDGGPARPFISMELVNGPPLTHHADQRGLSTRERLELFVGVCEAVQHAHQRGVIHRDLKPGNILVDEQVSPPRPKILDFGVARLADADIQGLTMQTGMGQLIGTLPYMSPEQIAGDPAEIDVRADVYALGVVLYQLLSGRLPIELGSRSIPEAARMIQEQPPPRLGTINRELRGDLETVVATALEKDKTRRYQSAADLAEDIRRYFDGRPIAARDASALELLRRQIRRYRGTVAVASLSIIALVALAAYAFSQSEKKSRLAESEEIAKTDAQNSERAAHEARQRADLAADQLRVELAGSRIERGRLLGRAGNLGAAEDLIWPQHLQDPSSPRTFWALWELYSRQPCLATFAGHTGIIAGAVFTADGQRVWTAAEDGLVKQWDMATLRCTVSFSAGVDRVREIALSPDERRLAAAGSSGEVAYYELPSGRELWRASAHPGGAETVAISPDGARVVTGGNDSAVRVWDAASGSRIAEMTRHGDAVHRVRFSPDGSLVGSGSVDARILLWDGKPDSDPAALREHTGGIGTLAFAPDGRTMVSGGADRRILLWDLESMRLRGTLLAPNGTVRTLNFSSDGRMLVSGGWWTTDLWDMGSRQRIRSLSLKDGTYTTALSRDDRRILSGFVDGMLQIWDLTPGAALTGVPGHSGRTVATLSPDGRTLATADSKGVIRLWEPPRSAGGSGLLVPARILASIPGHAAMIRTLRFSPDGALLLSASTDGIVHLWDLKTGRSAAEFGSVDALTSDAVSFSPDGRTLAAARTNGTITLLSVPDVKPIRTLPANGSEIVSLRFSPDGAMLAGASRDQLLRLWPVAGGEPASLRCGTVPWTTAFSPDGRRIAVGEWSKVIQIWDIQRRAVATRFEGHTGLVTGLEFMPGDPSMLVSCSTDGTIRLWESATGWNLATLDTFDGWDATSLAVAPDGRKVVSASINGQVVAWDLGYYDRHIAGNMEFQIARTAPALGAAAKIDEARAWAAGVLTPRQADGMPKPSPAAGQGVDPAVIEAWGRNRSGGS